MEVLNVVRKNAKKRKTYLQNKDSSNHAHMQKSHVKVPLHPPHISLPVETLCTKTFNFNET